MSFHYETNSGNINMEVASSPAMILQFMVSETLRRHNSDHYWSFMFNAIYEGILETWTPLMTSIFGNEYSENTFIRVPSVPCLNDNGANARSYDDLNPTQKFHLGSCLAEHLNVPMPVELLEPVESPQNVRDEEEPLVGSGSCLLMVFLTGLFLLFLVSYRLVKLMTKKYSKTTCVIENMHEEVKEKEDGISNDCHVQNDIIETNFGEIDELITQLSNMALTNETLKENIEEVTIEKHNVLADKQILIRTIQVNDEKHESQTQQLKNEVHSLQKIKEIMAQELEAMKIEKHQILADKQMSFCKLELAAEKTVSRQVLEIEDLKDEVIRLQAIEVNFKEKLDSITTERNNLVAEKEALKEIEEKYSNQIAELQSKKHYLLQETTVIEEKKSIMTNQIHEEIKEHEQKLCVYKQHFIEGEKIIEGLKTNIDNSKHKSRDLEKKNEHSQEILRDLETKITQQKDRLSHYEDRELDLKKQLDELHLNEQKISQSQATLQNMNDAIQEKSNYIRQVEELAKSGQQLKRDNDNTQDMLRKQSDALHIRLKNVAQEEKRLGEMEHEQAKEKLAFSAYVQKQNNLIVEAVNMKEKIQNGTLEGIKSLKDEESTLIARIQELKAKVKPLEEQIKLEFEASECNTKRLEEHQKHKDQLNEEKRTLNKKSMQLMEKELQINAAAKKITFDQSQLETKMIEVDRLIIESKSSAKNATLEKSKFLQMETDVLRKESKLLEDRSTLKEATEELEKQKVAFEKYVHERQQQMETQYQEAMANLQQQYQTLIQQQQQPQQTHHQHVDHQQMPESMVDEECAMEVDEEVTFWETATKFEAMAPQPDYGTQEAQTFLPDNDVPMMDAFKFRPDQFVKHMHDVDYKTNGNCATGGAPVKGFHIRNVGNNGEVYLNVRKHLHKYVVGPKGSTIRSLRRDFDVNIKIPHYKDRSDIIVVDGLEPHKVEKAVYAMQDIIVKSTAKQ